MGKKIKTALLLLAVYLLVFWVGFKSGTVFQRMQNKMQVEKVEIATPPNLSARLFYVVEKIDYGSYSRETVEEVNADNPIIRICTNEKLRPLLKSRDVKIYNGDGERVY